MKLLLDECTPQRLKADLTGREIFTVNDVGLRGVKNGALLLAAAASFEALITVDRKMPLQQSVSDLDQRDDQKNQDTSGTLRALRRAARRARELGARTATPVYVIRDHCIIDLTKEDSAVVRKPLKKREAR